MKCALSVGQGWNAGMIDVVDDCCEH